MKFYNVKLRSMVDVPDSDVEMVTMKNGKKASKGRCPVCGTSMFKIGG